MQPPALSSPPTTGRRIKVAFDARSAGPLRRRSFWTGWGGIIITTMMALLVIALLVGWVLLWVDRPDGPNMVLLVLGCVAFTAVLGLMAWLQNRLQAHWKLRQVEAALLSGISHNLRTPISGIRAAAQALRQEGLDAVQRDRLIAAIIQESRRLGLRVDNVLEAGRLEVERVQVDEPVELHEVVGRCLSAARGVVQGQGGTIAEQLEPASVTGDSRALTLLIDNLLDNAIKYTDGPPELSIQLLKHQGFALLKISDAGLGFDESSRTRLFRQYWRGDTGRSGTGLGLTLSRAIARGHGGELHLHSPGRGEGAVAEAWLPLSGGDNDG